LSSSDDDGNVPNEEHSEVRVDNITISDPGSCSPKLMNSLHVSIVKQEPAKPDPMYECLKDVVQYRFIIVNTKCRLKNGEEVNCSWSMYPAIKNAVFSFCCKLFSSLNVVLTKSGYDWRNLYHTMNNHEILKHDLEAHKRQNCLID
jgi:hypothetical protein